MNRLSLSAILLSVLLANASAFGADVVASPIEAEKLEEQNQSSSPSQEEVTSKVDSVATEQPSNSEIVKNQSETSSEPVEQSDSAGKISLQMRRPKKLLHPKQVF